MRKTSIYIVMYWFFSFFFFSHLYSQPNNCTDTSFRKRYASSDPIFIRDHITTAANQTLMVGRIDDPAQSSINGISILIDQVGNRIWSKRIESGINSHFTKTIQLADGSFLLGGPSSQDHSKIFLAKLTSTGNLIWSGNYSLDGRFSNSNFVDLYALNEGPNGDLFFTARASHFDFAVPEYDSTCTIIARLNNLGSIIWSRALSLEGATSGQSISNPAGIYFKNGKIVVIGQSFDLNGSCPTVTGALSGTTYWGMHVNYNSGDIELLKSYCYNEQPTSQWHISFLKYHFSSFQLSTGNIALFGRFYSSTNQNYFHYQVLFDDNLNIVKSKLYRTHRYGGSHSQIFVQKNGEINLYLTGYSVYHYWAKLNSNDQIIRERSMLFPATNSSGYNSYDFKSPNYTTYTSNFRISNWSYIEHTQLQDNDPTIDSCLGADTSFVSVLPFDNITPTNFTWRSIVINPLISTTLNTIITDESLIEELVCGQISRCDSLKISGPDTICVVNNATELIGLKNAECRNKVLWNIETSLPYSSVLQNDSTISVNFQAPSEEPGTAIIYASAANCTIAKDTMVLRILPQGKNLPADTTICSESTNIKLTPGKWFNNYLWQDGSTDSVFVVTNPGIYWVKAESACGAIFSDTIEINKSYISVGDDIWKCASDTVIIAAPPGLLNYTWSPATDIITSNTNASIFTNTNSVYTIAAESAEGCILTDTIEVNIYPQFYINLGLDTSICSGESLSLDAGEGFDSYYWNDGSTGRYKTITSEGIYIIKAINSNNCISSDTIILEQVYPLPGILLPDKNTLCRNQDDILDAGSGFSSYLWQDNSTDQTLRIDFPGSYWVTVTDSNNCLNSDTAHILSLVDPPSDFILTDTLKCQYDIIKLMPYSIYSSYLWNDGSIASSLEVSHPGNYSLKVTDQNGCTGTQEIVVGNKACLNSIHFPSAFTPNNDGKNDVFKPIIRGHLYNYSFEIYNRWGERIFRSPDPLKGWNGLFGNKPQSGVFVWTCKYQFENQLPEIRKGTVLLIR